MYAKKWENDTPRKEQMSRDFNKLGEAYGAFKSRRAIFVSKVVRYHKPKTEKELAYLIDAHKHYYKCGCGVSGNATLKEIGMNLYEDQIKLWGEYRYSEDEAYWYAYRLFVPQSFKGFSLEQEALNKLQPMLQAKGFRIREAKPHEDFKYAIDLVVGDNITFTGAIQVKPDSFRCVSNTIKSQNLTSNSKLTIPVYYLYYNSTGEFENLDEIFYSLIGENGSAKTE